MIVWTRCLTLYWRVALIVLAALAVSAEAHCPNDVSPAGLAFPAEGGAGSFDIQTDPGCPWTVVSDSAWLAVTSAKSGFSAATVRFSVTRNGTLARRTGNLTVTGNVFTVSQASAAAAVADLAISKSHTGDFTVGLRADYSIAVSNIGAVASSGSITVIDALPSGLTPVSASGSGWDCGASGAIVSCSRSDPLPVGASTTVTIAVDVSEPAFPGLINIATVSNSSDSFSENNTASDPTQVSSGETSPLPSGAPTEGVLKPDSLGFPCSFSRQLYSVEVPPRAIQLIVSLLGDPGAQLLVRSRAGANSTIGAAEFSARSFASNKFVYVGAQSQPPLTDGPYLIRVANCTSETVSFVLTATVITSSSPLRVEELAADDGSQESGLLGDGVIVVNRLTPVQYPSRLKAIRAYFTQFQVEPNPIGGRLRLVAFADPSGSGRPPDLPSILVDQEVTVTGENEFIDFPLDNQPILFSGDWYVGFQHAKPGNGVFVAADSGRPHRNASFYSEDEGVTFLGPALNPTVPLNFMIRAVVDSMERTRRRP